MNADTIRKLGLVLLASLALGAGQERPDPSHAAQLGATGASTRAPLTGGSHAASGTGVVEARDQAGGTLTIGGDGYLVTPATRFFDANGEAIPIQKLPVAQVFRDEPRVDTRAIVSFEAAETSRGWALESVRVVGQPPR